MMTILYDYQAFTYQRFGGVSRYFCELARYLAQRPDARVRILAGLYVSGMLRECAEALHGAVLGAALPAWVPEHRALSLLNRAFFACAHGRVRADIYHPTYYRWLPHRGPAKRIVTVYDMIHERYADMFPPADPTSARKRLAVTRADGIICISETTRRDLVSRLGPLDAPVRVIHLGLHLDAPPAARPPLDAPFLLFVGQRGRYKNFDRLLSAYAENRAVRDAVHLVCFGGERVTPREQAALRRAGLQDRVRFVRGDDAALATCYAHARGLVYPSLYEGFGLPPLEAMKYGCPVAVSNQGALPETVGDAGLYFDPTRTEAISQALQTLLFDDALRDELVARGRRRFAAYDGERCAQETFAFYREIAGV